MTTYTHHHTALSSAAFAPEDAVWTQDQWSIYLDDTLERWEVYVDAVGRRTFTSSQVWESLDGPAQVAFLDDFLHAYQGTSVRSLCLMDSSQGSVYAQAARSSAMPAVDRVGDLHERAQAHVVASAGINRASSALQRQVFAVRHAVLEQDLADLEQEVARVRSALALSASALFSGRDV